MPPLKTRLAPSPTGHLHLGHALHVLCVQGIAALQEASISLRLEDHDRSRCRQEFEDSIIQDLKWLGFESPNKPWRQSERFEVYQTHLEKLMSRGQVFACACSRKEIQEQTAQSSGELRYPGTCRELGLPLDRPNTSLRLKLPNGPNPFRDLFLGTFPRDMSDDHSDVMIRDRLGQWTYQFAVVVDDLEQGINLIIRGTDLLSSTGRQLAIRRLIDPQAATPLFAHHPLLSDQSGQKLSKRFGSDAISKLRDEGLSPADVRGLAAHLGGLTRNSEPLSVTQLAHLFKEIV
jgi:glutamyl-Q tRNA(Asp) synthetase